MNLSRRAVFTGLALAPLGAAYAAAPKNDPQADQAAISALHKLVAGSPAAKRMNGTAAGVLVFPKIVKAGFLLGGAYGEGVLLKGGKPAGYYNSVAASYGLQAGVQWFGYALFFMNQGALGYLDSSQGFEIGVGPSVVVVDQGMGKKMTSATLTQDIYAFIFNQKGLMAGLGLEGSKITRI